MFKKTMAAFAALGGVAAANAASVLDTASKTAIQGGYQNMQEDRKSVV